MTEFVLCYSKNGDITLVNVAEIKYIHRFASERWPWLETKDGNWFEYQYDDGDNVQDIKRWFGLETEND